jgi:hypothetical protein
MCPLMWRPPFHVVETCSFCRCCIGCSLLSFCYLPTLYWLFLLPIAFCLLPDWLFTSHFILRTSPFSRLFPTLCPLLSTNCFVGCSLPTSYFVLRPLEGCSLLSTFCSLPTLYWLFLLPIAFCLLPDWLFTSHFTHPTSHLIRYLCCRK